MPWPTPTKEQGPWFDLPTEEAHTLVSRALRLGLLNEPVALQLKYWEIYGFLKIPASLSLLGTLCDYACSRMEAIWAQRNASPNDRLHNLYREDACLDLIFRSAVLREYASVVFGTEAHPKYSINFLRGSEQAIHQDSTVFMTWPKNFLLGAWIALEDIGPDCGPLVYHPGSHRESWPGWTDPPQTCLKTCDRETAARYYAWVEETKAKYPAEVFTAKKGDVLLWHAGLFHGGSKIVNPALSRKSMVIHYVTATSDVASKCHGPFNWD